MGAQVLEFPTTRPTRPTPTTRPRLVLVPQPGREPEPTYRLTRRGRLVVALELHGLAAAGFRRFPNIRAARMPTS